MGLWSRFRRTLLNDGHLEEIREELDFHLQGDAADGRGLRNARLRLGNPKRIEEETREAGIYGWLESLLQDIRYGLRQFRKAPGLFLAVVASLAIGLGANTAIFSLIDAAVLRPLPVAEPDRLIQLEWRNDEMLAGVGFLIRAPIQTNDGLVGGMVSEPLFRDFSSEQTAFASLVGVLGTTDSIAISTNAGTPAVEVQRHYVSGNFFDGLGVRPASGRFFVEEEDLVGAEVAIVVSHRFWSGRLGGDPDAIGRIVRTNDEPARIVGVAPPGFFGLNRGEWIDVYQPLATHPFFQAGAPPPFRNYWSVTTVARLAPGVSASAAARAMTPLFRSLVAEATAMEIEPDLELVTRPVGRALWANQQPALDIVSEALWILMLLVGVLLLIVCANVANLLLSRSESRRRESAVRLALGAGRTRLVRQHLVESGMLAGIGGALGLVLGTAVARWIHALFQSGLGAADAFAVVFDWRLSIYAAAISILTALVFGLAPAWTAAQSKVNDALKIQTRSVLGGGLRLPKLLVSIQFALSFAALVGAGLLGRSLGNLYSTDPGFDTGELSYATVRPGQAGVERGPFMERLEEEVAAIPGVLEVASLERRPLDGGGSGSYVRTPGGPPTTLAEGIGNPEAYTSTVRGGPGFLEVLGIPVLTGRAPEARDACPPFGPGSALASSAGPVRPICPVVVDERFAAVFFPGETPVGRRFELPNVTPAFDYEIVGLVANARIRALRDEALPTMYYVVPTAFPMDHFAIRAAIDPGALASAVQQAVARVDPSVPLAEFHTQAALIDRLLRTERLLALVSGAFSLAALLLAAVGLGGLLAYAVARRTNEIGIRMALGASSGEVRRMVLGDSLLMVGLGLLIGIPTALAVGRYLGSQLFGLGPIDAPTALLALAALGAVAVIAAMLPARRASRISPLEALRHE